MASYFNGTIWGWNPGTATITFRATDGSGRMATHRVTVRPRPVPPQEEPEEWWVLSAFGLISQPGNAFLQRILGNINAFVIFAFGRRDWNESSSGNSLEEFLRNNGMTINTPNNSMVDVIVSGNDVTIRTGFNYTGTLNEQQFRNWFEAGIRNHWGGTYQNVFGFTVNVSVEINNDRRNRINVELIDSAGTSVAHLGPQTTQWFATITIFRNFSNGTVRTQAQFNHVSAHEFGHILGLADAPQSVVSIMAPGTTHSVQRRDIEAFIRAYATNRPQNP